MRSRVARLAGLDDSAGPEQAVNAVHRRLAEAPSMLMCATLDDLARSERRPNIPGADEVRPNWSLPLPMTLDEIMADSLSADLADDFNR
jgi:4-alpha-glucanotransferase